MWHGELGFRFDRALEGHGPNGHDLFCIDISGSWADEPIEPHLTVRYIPAVYGVRPVPRAFCNSREQAEGWAAAELKRFRAKGFLVWSRRDHTVYDEYGVNPRRLPVSFRHRGASAWMQVSGRQQRFLLGSDGGVITRSYGLDQPC